MEGLIFSKHNLRGRPERRRHFYWTVNVIVADCRWLPAEGRTLMADICRRTGKKIGLSLILGHQFSTQAVKRAGSRGSDKLLMAGELKRETASVFSFVQVFTWYEIGKNRTLIYRKYGIDFAGRASSILVID